MRANCKKSCGTCPKGNFTGWAWHGDAISGSGSLSIEGLCVDADGQLPAGSGGGNVMHLLQCEDGKKSQQWTRSGGQLRSLSAVGQCLAVFAHWLWDYVPVVMLQGCASEEIEVAARADPTPRHAAAAAAGKSHMVVDTSRILDGGVPGSQLWTINKNGTLVNGQYGCVEASGSAGPASTIWEKALTGGRKALLAINGADLAQETSLDLASLTGKASWQVRDVWGAKDLGKQTTVARSLPPHDCLLLVLSP